MFISELIIEEFASLKNRRIKLDRSFNLITGENETGKSTISAFIKFIFYGFSDSKERERFSSLQTGIAKGAMLVEYKGKVYRIERRTTLKEQPVIIRNESDGAEFTEWKSSAKTPGDYFLSIPVQLYTRSVYVSQADGAKLDGGTAEAINNIFLAGDETLNLKRAKKKLDDARKNLKLKRGSGGMIYECETRISELERQKSDAQTRKKQLEYINNALQDEKSQAILLKKRLDTAVNTQKEQKALRLMQQLNRLDDLAKQKEKNETLLKVLEEDNSYYGFIPDENYEKELISLKTESSFYKKEIEQNELRITAIKEQKATPPKGYDAYLRFGKAESILSLYRRKSSLFKIFGTVFFSFCALFIFSAVALFLKLFERNLAVFIPLIVLSGAGAILFGVLQIFQKKSISELKSELHADKSHTVGDICRTCELYEQSIKTNETDYILNSITENTSKINVLNEKIKHLLERWNKPSVDTAISDYNRYTERTQELKNSIARLENEITAINSALSAYTEADISEARSFTRTSYVQERSVISETDIEFLKNELDKINEKCKNYEIELAQGGNQTPVDVIAAELSKEKEKLSDLMFKYNAINLASDSLDEAEKNMRSKVSPYLGTFASKYFSEITTGKYLRLLIDDEMNLSSEASENSSTMTQEYFSGGNADLAWLCLRFAIHKQLSENEAIPLILDEALVYFDDIRLSLILKELYNSALDGVQVICFSASSREFSVLGEAVNRIKL